MKILVAGLFLVLILVSALYGQGSVPSFSVGARNASMVDANIAESGDVSAMYENPAALAFLENGAVFINHSQGGSPLAMQENVALPLLLKSPVVVAVGLDEYNIGYLGGSVPDSQRILEYGYDFSLAAEITPTLSFGGSAAIRHGMGSSGTQAWGGFFSVSADYAPTPDVSYSLVFGGIGTDVMYAIQDSAVMAANGVLPRTLEVGATMVYPSSASLRSPILIISFANEKIFNVKGLFYKGGIEIRPFEFIEMRFGYMAGPGVSTASYGLGFLASGFSLQYAICPQHGTRILLQQFSAALDF